MIIRSWEVRTRIARLIRSRIIRIGVVGNACRRRRKRLIRRLKVRMLIICRNNSRSSRC